MAETSLDAHAKLHRNKRAKSGRIQDAGLAHDTLGRKTAYRKRVLRHCIQRVADYDHHRCGAGVLNLCGHRADDLGIGGQQVVATHARLAGNAGGDDDHVAVGRVGVVARADNIAVETHDRRGFHQIQGLAFGHVAGGRDVQ